MPVINLEQGGPAWLSYRQGKVMATDTPVILGSNPWVTKLERWEEKMGIRPGPEMNDAMREGQRKEPIARALIEDMLGIKFIPIVYENDIHSWLAASLDGISECGRFIIEIKCPTKAKLHFENKRGEIPEYYFDQMQHQLICTPKAEVNFFCTYLPDDKECPVKITESVLHKEKKELILEKGYDFYSRNMCNFEAPTEWKLNKK